MSEEKPQPKQRVERVNWLGLAKYLHDLSAETLPNADEIVAVLRKHGGMIAAHHPEVVAWCNEEAKKESGRV